MEEDPKFQRFLENYLKQRQRKPVGFTFGKIVRIDRQFVATVK